MKVSFDDLVLDRGKVLRFLGYASKPVPPLISRKIDEELSLAGELLQPAAFYKNLQIEAIAGDRVILEGGVEFNSRYAAEGLKDCTKACLAIYTVGGFIETRIQEYSNGNEMIRGMILDKIGVVALDDLNRQLREVVASASGGCMVSCQLFPSQKDFSVSSQKTIHDLFTGENNAIAISEYFQLQPVKSAAVVMGLGKTEESLTMCENCDKPCSQRMVNNPCS